MRWVQAITFTRTHADSSTVSFLGFTDLESVS